MSRQKDVKNYYMNLSGIAYDPIRLKSGEVQIRVANLLNESQRSLYRLSSNKLSLISSTFPTCDRIAYEKKLIKNLKVILTGLK